MGHTVSLDSSLSTWGAPGFRGRVIACSPRRQFAPAPGDPAGAGWWTGGQNAGGGCTGDQVNKLAGLLRGLTTRCINYTLYMWIYGCSRYYGHWMKMLMKGDVHYGNGYWDAKDSLVLCGTCSVQQGHIYMKLIGSINYWAIAKKYCQGR